MGPKTKSAHLLRWHYGERVTMGQFSNSFPKHFSYLCEYAFRFDLSCSFCEYRCFFHCLHCSPSCFDPDSLLLAHLWLGLSWIDYISANKRFSSSKTSSRKPYTSSKQQERHKHSAENTRNFSTSARACVEEIAASKLSHTRTHPLCHPNTPLFIETALQQLFLFCKHSFAKAKTPFDIHKL